MASELFNQNYNSGKTPKKISLKIPQPPPQFGQLNWRDPTLLLEFIDEKWIIIMKIAKKSLVSNHHHHHDTAIEHANQLDPESQQ